MFDLQAIASPDLETVVIFLGGLSAFLFVIFIGVDGFRWLGKGLKVCVVAIVSGLFVGYIFGSVLGAISSVALAIKYVKNKENAEEYVIPSIIVALLTIAPLVVLSDGKTGTKVDSEKLSTAIQVYTCYHMNDMQLRLYYNECKAVLSKTRRYGW